MAVTSSVNRDGFTSSFQYGCLLFPFLACGVRRGFCRVPDERRHPSTAGYDVACEVFIGALYQVKDPSGFSSFTVNFFFF